VRDEMADVLLYLVRLADRLDVDLLAAARAKIAKNALKYPVERSKGSARKYDEL
jgi:NTP pyrophosphatase (non-canonical NTP hydrolase)